jgi:hypothetical protein
MLCADPKAKLAMFPKRRFVARGIAELGKSSRGREKCIFRIDFSAAQNYKMNDPACELATLRSAGR